MCGWLSLKGGFGHISHKCLRRKSKAAKELAKKVGEQHWQVRIEGGFWRAVIRRQSLEVKND